MDRSAVIWLYHEIQLCVISIDRNINAMCFENILQWSNDKENSSGPKTDPCGTPYLTVEVAEFKLFTLTNWVRSSRYEASHFQAFPENVAPV